MQRESTTGKLLIATPAIGDGNFEQSVIFMLHHDSDGALGVIINDATALEVSELLPRWGDLSTKPAVIFRGGPVEQSGFIGVGRPVPAYDATAATEGTVPVAGTGLVTVDLESDPAIAAAHIDGLRLFRGYSGWGAHQLDTELASGAWFTVEAKASDLWSENPEGLYEQVLLRQSGQMRWFANAPRDPSQN